MISDPKMTEAGLVEEVPGYYGSVKIEESVAQRIWSEQDFFTDSLVTNCGKKVYVDYPGEWNISMEGPDFRNAKLVIDGESFIGDVEIHFFPEGWKSHKHHLDSNYNKVILHVCIFSGASGVTNQERTSNGKAVPCLVLLPSLLHGIEEYAETHVLARLSGHDSLADFALNNLVGISLDDCKERARSRWMAKKGFAHSRLLIQGWEMACHQWFLEILGYRRNRTQMARIAQQFSIDLWKSGQVDLDLIYRSQGGWKLRGCRPANHPLTRLCQYAELWRTCPQWIEGLSNLWDTFAFQALDKTGSEIEFPKVSQLSGIWIRQLLGEVFGRGKANTLWIDAAWPLICAARGKNGFSLWMSWPAGDCPQKYRDWAKKLSWTNPSGKKPFTNGLVQCIIQTLSVGSCDPEKKSLIQ
jgi:hypothetical protein